MRRTGWLIGGAALVLLAGSGWLMAAEQARSQAASAMELLEASLPPGSSVTYGELRISPTGTTRIDRLRIRLGPEGRPGALTTAETLELEGVRPDGRIGRASCTGLVSDEAGTRVEVGSFAVQDVQPATFAALLGGPSVPEANAGAITAERLALDHGGDRVRMDRMALAGVEAGRFRDLSAGGVKLTSSSSHEVVEVRQVRAAMLDLARVDWPALSSAMAEQTAAREDPAAFLAMARTLLTLADGTARDLELAGLSATSAAAPGASVQLQGASIAELSGARLGPVQLTGLAVNSPDAGLTFEAARYRMDFDPFPLAELRAAATQLPRTPEGAAELRRQLAAVTGRYEGGVDRLVIDGRGSGVKAGAGQLRFAGSTDALRMQTQGWIDALALELGRTPGGGSGPGSLARALGDLTGSMRAAWSTDRRAGTASLDSMGLDLDGLAAIQADGVAGMPADGSTLGPDPAAFSLVRARLVYTDRSLLLRLLTAWGEPSGLAPEMVADAFAGMIANPSTTPWLNRPARTALAQFLRQPGRLQIELAPAAPLSGGELLGLALQRPSSFAATAGLRVSATPP
jgi:hypothetical protein